MTTGFIGNRTLLVAEAALAEAETMTTAEIAQLVLTAELAGSITASSRQIGYAKRDRRRVLTARTGGE